MIRKEDLLPIARLKGLSPKLAELDYIQDIALLSVSMEFGSRLVFKGGTCLFKAYKLNRFSEDLDFTARKGFKQKDFFHRLPYFFGLLDIRCKVRVETFQNNVNESFDKGTMRRSLLSKTLFEGFDSHTERGLSKPSNAYLEAIGPLYDGSKETTATLSFNISSRERAVLPVRRFPYISLYQEVRPFDLFVMDEREILAEKIRAIYARNKARDVYDVWYLLKLKGTPFDEVGIVNKKLSHDGMKFEKGAFLAKIEEKKTSWERDLSGLVGGELPRFAKVKSDIAGLLRNG